MVEAIHAVMNSLAGVDASNTERKPMLTVPGTQVQSDETEEFAQIGRQIKPDCPACLQSSHLRCPTRKSPMLTVIPSLARTKAILLRLCRPLPGLIWSF